MPRPSSIDKLPEEIRVEIGRLRGMGWTIDQIMEQLRGLLDQAPSRSAVGRHIQKTDRIGERLRRTRQIAEAQIRRLGEATESQAARLNIEMTHATLFEMLSRLVDIEEGGDPDSEKVQWSADEIMKLAKAQDHLGRANKASVEIIAAAEKRAAEQAKKEAVVAVEAVAKTRGISGETLEAIKAGIFGVKAA